MQQVIKKIKKDNLKGRAKRVMKKKEPQIVEVVKSAMFVSGNKTSATIRQTLLDLYMLKKPHAIHLSRKHDIHPFDDEVPLEKYSYTYECSWFVFGSNTKRRPNNLIFGRLFDYHVIEMMEFQVEDYKSISEFEGQKCQNESKPCLIFNGEEFEHKFEYQKFRNMMIDLYRGKVVSSLNLAAIDKIFSFTIINNKIYFKVYVSQLKRTGTKFPRIELVEMGPSMILTLRRTKFATEDTMKLATQVHKSLKQKKKKNVSQSNFGDIVGQIHLDQQNLSSIVTKRPKALRRTKRKTQEKPNDNELEKEKEK
ncbi:brix domain containing protein [Anaeramoeba ignava]|uniref:Ribosome production factor 2 homolog n=1 Tax=Anaeramoeba ignava TaxID=1746090 RepID=A0A9Q0RBR0_ANAIG|nr:brix domain containing protein [Anaeramoeba ignava]